jgi:hypothetical protein
MKNDLGLVILRDEESGSSFWGTKNLASLPPLSRVGFLFEPAEGFSLGEVGMFN